MSMVSVVIPVLNEARLLPRCLERVAGQAREAGAEVLVVDGGSDDGSGTLAGAWPGVRKLRTARGRGRQMNAGAHKARGSLLVFLPADTMLPDGALPALARIDRNGLPVAGGFRQRFDADRPLLRAVSAASNLRARVTGIFYGDQVPFLRRELFEHLGGYREDVEMEDLELGCRLRRRCRPRALSLTVTTSARRFDRGGDLRTGAEALRLTLAWLFLRRVPRSSRFFTPVR